MRWITRILAFLLTILFVLTAVLSLVLFNVEQQAFQAATYEQALQDGNLYSRVPQVLAATLSNRLSLSGSAGQSLPFQSLTVDEWTTLLTSLLPPQDIRTMTESTLDQLFSYLNGKSTQVTVSLIPIKQNLAQNGFTVVQEFLQTQPDCTPSQVLDMGAAVLAGKDPFANAQVLCNPPLNLLALVKPQVEAATKLEADVIPDSLPLHLPPQSRLQSLKNARLLMHLSPLLPLGLLLAVTLLAVRSLRDWLAWWGAGFLFTGGIGVGLYYLAIPLFQFLFKALLLTQVGSQLSGITIDFLSDLISVVTRSLLGAMGGESLLLLAAGLLMIVVRYLLPGPQVDPAQGLLVP